MSACLRPAQLLCHVPFNRKRFSLSTRQWLVLFVRWVAAATYSSVQKTGSLGSIPVHRYHPAEPDRTPCPLTIRNKHGRFVLPSAVLQNTDAAAAVMLMTRREAQRRGLPIMATLRSFATVRHYS
jgi:hypothetical protein